MTLSNQGVLSFGTLAQSGSMPIRSTTSPQYAYLKYAINQSQILIQPDAYYSVGTPANINAANYPCYSVTQPTTQTWPTTGNMTIPFGLGPVTITAMPITGATALTAHTPYTISTLGTTDFTLIGASSNTVGLQFVATGAGTGTGSCVPSITIGQSMLMAVGLAGAWGNYTSFPVGNQIRMIYGIVTAFNAATPSVTVNITYYRAYGQINFITSGTFYVHSAFPFLLTQPTQNTTIDQNCGFVNGGTTWRVPEIGLVFDSESVGAFSSLSTFLSNMIPVI